MDATNLTEQELSSLCGANPHKENFKGKWICQDCMDAVDADMIFGFKKHTRCARCNKQAITYEVL